MIFIFVSTFTVKSYLEQTRMNQTSLDKNMIEESALLEGEVPMPGAPSVLISDSKACIPQHFMTFQHDRQSVEEVVSNIDFDEDYFVFVDEDKAGVFIQLGIVGKDNYRQDNDKKIVYGRRWRVEATLPTSEIIQTVFLAIKSAREHEIRELFKLSILGGVATPFNNHHDLPMMANYTDQFLCQSHANNKLQSDFAITDLLASITYDKAKFTLIDIEQRHNGTYLIDIQILPFFQGRLPELINKTLTLLVHELTANAVLHELMTQLVQLSNRYVEENFKFKQFARFSRSVSIDAIANTSILTRSNVAKEASESFKTVFKNSNYETDITRVPSIHDSALGCALRNRLKSFGSLQGILPKNFFTN